MKPYIRSLQILIAAITLLIGGCSTEHFEDTQKLDRTPSIDPDYADVTIPPNIAPMNFRIQEDGNFFRITVSGSSNKQKFSVTSADGIVRFPEDDWKEMLGSNKGNTIEIQIFSSKKEANTLKQFRNIQMHVANEPIDSYLG